MYIVTEIEKINSTRFDEIYNGNKTQLIENIGYDDLNLLKSIFSKQIGAGLLFQAVNNSNEVVAYYVGVRQSSTEVFMHCMITDSTETLPLTVESSANILKSLGFTHVYFSVKNNTSTHTYCKNSMNRTDLYEYLNEEIYEGNYMKVKLKLV